MNDEEQEKIRSYIAMCKCCLLAEAMKDCAVCRFNIGLRYKRQPLQAIPLPIQLFIPHYALAEEC